MTLPAPLVPAECVLTGYDWFPLHFDRLRKSKWWRRASDLARARNIMLWGEAWRGTPAGSLAADDDDLAEAAGFGFDVDAFLAVKAEIMAPWTLCADGRWYHAFLCDLASVTWERRKDKRAQTAARMAALRARKQKGCDAEIATVEGAVTRHTVGSDASHSTRGEEKRGEDIQAVASAPPTAAAPPPKLIAEDVREAFDAWNAIAERLGLPVARKLSDGRRRQIAARLKEDGLDGWRKALQAVERSRFCRGMKDGAWRADIDFICQPSSWNRLLEGSYGTDATVASPVEPKAQFPGPAEVRAAVVAAAGEDLAIGYLDICTWRDVPVKAIVTTLGGVAAKLRAEAGPALAALSVTILVEKAA